MHVRDQLEDLRCEFRTPDFAIVKVLIDLFVVESLLVANDAVEDVIMNESPVGRVLHEDSLGQPAAIGLKRC